VVEKQIWVLYQSLVLVTINFKKTLKEIKLKHKIVCFHCGMIGLHKGGKKFCHWKDLSQAEAREKGLEFVTDYLQAAN
jgi:hypothetical protein